MQNYTTSFLVDKTPDEVFAAINNVRGWWWGTIEGDSGKVGDRFTYTVPDVHYSAQSIAELVPGKKVVWHVFDAKLSFDKSDEWKGTDIVFEIGQKDGQTEVRFTHRGLVSAFECYSDCSNAWGLLVGGNLKKFIQTGKTQPSPW